MANPVLRFKFRKTHNVDLADGVAHNIRFELRERTVDRGRRIVEPFYLFDEVHELELADEDFNEPTRPAHATDRRYEMLVDAEYIRAQEATVRNNRIREHVQMYVKDGTIEVVDDPFGNAGSECEATNV